MSSRCQPTRAEPKAKPRNERHDMDRESSKHSPRLDEEMEEEDQTILRSGQPPRTEEWRETEPFDPGHLEYELPEEEEPAAPPGDDPGGRGAARRHRPLAATAQAPRGP